MIVSTVGAFSFASRPQPSTRSTVLFKAILVLTLLIGMMASVRASGFRRLIPCLKSSARDSSKCRSPHRNLEEMSQTRRRYWQQNHRRSILAASLHTQGTQHLTSISRNTSRCVYIAVGSNLGDRFRNIATALRLLSQSDDTCTDEHQMQLRIRKTSFLHETAPMYVVEQPPFLNGVVEAETTLHPHALLKRIKEVEEQLGRDLNGKRNGPRPVDLDILFMSEPDLLSQSRQLVFDSPQLTVPHPRIAERQFVLTPMCELNAHLHHPLLNSTVRELLEELKPAASDQSATRVLPLPRGRFLTFNQTLVMGILNVTPDSFSDGGDFSSAELAAERALQMEREGAHIIDIGGESTRPGAKEVAIQEELDRTIPVIQRIRQVSDIPISIDTRHSIIAKAAVEAGADIVNDVSAGEFDSEMLSTVAKLQVPFILMHMRGTPEDMQNMTEYADIVSEVSAALLDRSREAELAGIPRWLQVLDPGIGFAKETRGNLLLLRHFNELRSRLGGFPLLLGTSRKGFIGKITGEQVPRQRDSGSLASCVAALCRGDYLETSPACNILRVHNVKATRQATLTMDAIIRAT